MYNLNYNLSVCLQELSGRSNVILLGDSVGDAKMADGVPHDTVLKIGFLNNHVMNLSHNIT